MGGKLELIVNNKSILGEGPWWDNNKKILYWTDGLGCKIHAYNVISKVNRTINVNQYVGCIIPREKGGFILALQYGLYFLDTYFEKLEKIIDPEEGVIDNRLNDGKCDSRGRFWFGSMSMIPADKFEDIRPSGALYCIDKDLIVKKVANEIRVSNGIIWSLDNKIMYYIDSSTRKVVAYDFDIEKGEINNKSTVINIPEKEGIPDGMTIDEEGMLWVAQWGGYRVSRWNPNNGKKLYEVLLPVKNVSSCIFAGENLDELYITTARSGLSNEELSSQPLAGGLFMIKPGVKGIQCYKFSG